MSMSLTWRDFVGPVCIFVDGLWQNGKVVEIKTNEVVYKLSGDPDSFIISKDEAHKIIRKRGTVASAAKGEQYTGSNPLVFGPKGCNIYGKRIVERKDRPGTYRVHVKYQTRKHHKVRNIKINLGKHVRFLMLLVYFTYLFHFLTNFVSECRKIRPQHHSLVIRKFVNGSLQETNLYRKNANEVFG